ncbi:MAG: NUDIX hydrolase [Pseudomonadota bacterium]
MSKPENLPGFKSAYDKEDDGDVVLKNERSPRPKDAATLILVRPSKDQKTVEVLMGKRSRGHVFMPDKYVFPGGRVDAPDGRVPAASELHPRSTEQLLKYARRKPRAFALTAIRETFEETGLIVGAPCAEQPKTPNDWTAFFQQGAQPSLSGLRFVGRAVTPPYRPKRFDARFFMADAREALIDDRPPVDGAELSDLQWISLDDAMSLDLPSVTRFMLGEVAERAENPRKQQKPPFLRWTASGHKMERL